MTRLNTGKRVHTKSGLQLRGRLKPATVHQELRILRSHPERGGEEAAAGS